MNQAWLGYLLSGCALLCFTTGILTTKKASSLMPLSLGFLVATTTNVAFSALIFGLQWVWRSEPVGWDRTALTYFLAAGVLATYLGRWFFYESVVVFGPAKASVFQVSSPLFTALLAWIFLAESLEFSVFMAMLIAIAGLLLISAKPSGAAPGQRVEGEPRGLLAKWMRSLLFLGLGSSLAYGLGNVLRGAAIRDWNEPILGGLLGSLSGLLMYFLFTPEKLELFTRLKNAPRQGLWLYALIGVATVSGQILTIGAMRFIPVSVATLMTLCTPLIVIPLSRYLYGTSEKLTLNLLLGAALALAGVTWVVMR